MHLIPTDITGGVDSSKYGVKLQPSVSFLTFPGGKSFNGRRKHMDATRQTAAGVTLGDDRFDPQEPLDPFDFREPSDPDRRPLLSRLPLLSFLRLSFLSLPRELRDPERAGVALRGFCLPAWENSHSLPLLQRPAFQYLHVILDLIVFTLPTRRTTSTWFSSFLRRSLVFVRAVFFGATALVPCDTVPLWDERSFLPTVVDCRSGRLRTSKAAVDPTTVRLKPFPPEVPLYSINKELVGMILSSLFSTIVDFDVMLDGTYIFDLFIEQGFQD